MSAKRSVNFMMRMMADKRFILRFNVFMQRKKYLQIKYGVYKGDI